jgi:hypothetical protein
MHLPTRPGSVLARVALCLAAAFAAPVAVAQSVNGELTTRYRDRSGNGDWEDEDFYSYLRLSIWDDEHDRELGGALSMRWNADLLTRSNEFDDGNDDLRIHYAYVDVNKLDKVDLRLGRQIVDAAEGWHLTGLSGSLEAPWKGLRIGIFGGQPVSYYRAPSDEWTAGTTFSLKPERQGLLRGSWIHVDEEHRNDDVATLSYRRASAAGWNVFGTVRTLNFDVWNEYLGGSWHSAPAGLRVDASYRRQEETNDIESRYYYGHLSSVVGASQPYHLLTLSLNRSFGDHLSLGAGGNRRELLGGDTQNRGNQEYTRSFLDVQLHDRLLRGFEASFDLSHWSTERNDNTTLSGSLSRRVGETLRFDLGTYYSKYEARRLFEDEAIRERYDVRSFYLRAGWKVRRRYGVRVDFERASDSTSDDALYQVEIRLGLDLGFLSRGGRP